MKIVFIGPGIMSIPPLGWGAVEILIWDYKCYIEKIYENKIIVHIINTPNKQKIIDDTNNIIPDIVHIHYDVFWDLVPNINCKNIILTSHYGYITSSCWFNEYYDIFNGFLNSTAYIHCLSDKVFNIYKSASVPEDRLFIIENGANEELFNFTSTPQFLDKSIYLGKIEPRKNQSKYQDIINIDFVGEIHDSTFNSNNPNYIGNWSKEDVYNKLSHYANLVLLSDGEVHPLVVCEALICGLGIVVSEAASANLDITHEFITVIPNNKLNDLSYISEEINKNKLICKTPEMRMRIRTYGINNFSYDKIIRKYIYKISQLLQ
jgi:hypothetical protein